MNIASDPLGKRPRTFPRLTTLTSRSIKSLGLFLFVVIALATWFWWPREAAVSFPLIATEEEASIAAMEASSTIESSTEFDQKTIGATEDSDNMKIYVSGAVLNPGVYDLRSGMRICDAVAAAGGLLDTAAVGYVNLAATIQDGEQIAIPTQAELASGQSASAAPTNSAFYNGSNPPSGSAAEMLVNINLADVATLDTLPGVGPTTAQRIVDYREKYGPFDSTEELKDVSGIGDKKFADLVDRIRI